MLLNATSCLCLVSESDEGFEVTMTATADGELSEGRVAEIQVHSLFFFSFFFYSVLKQTEELNTP